MMMVLALMLALLIAPSKGAPAPVAERGRTISLVDYAFTGLPSAAIAEPARTEVWTIRNDAPSLHQIQMLRLQDSTGLPAIDQWIARGASPLLPPAPLVVYVSALLPGAATTERVALEPGLYVVLCFVPAGRDASGGIVNHAHLGMRQTFGVR